MVRARGFVSVPATFTARHPFATVLENFGAGAPEHDDGMPVVTGPDGVGLGPTELLLTGVGTAEELTGGASGIAFADTQESKSLLCALDRSNVQWPNASW